MSAMIELRGVRRSFGATHALRGIDLSVRAGQIHALVGENGAGKSTCLGLIAGRIAADAGEVLIDGRALRTGSPHAARSAGIAAIYQELTLVPQLSAQANVFLGAEPRRFGLPAERSMRRRYAELAARLGTAIDPRCPVGRLSVAEQQMVEIMRALHTEARVMLFDEPTAALAETERARLLTVLSELRAHGVAVVVVSHNLEEVLSIADVVTVFREGQVQSTRARDSWTKRSLVEAMLGRALSQTYAAGPVPARPGAELIAATGLTVPGILDDVTLSVHAGEIVGLAGLVGSGRTTTLRALAGAESQATGTLRVAGQAVAWPHTPRAARQSGIALIPEDRKRHGLMLGHSAASNVTISNIAMTRRHGVVSAASARRHAARATANIGFDPARLGRTAGQLSGGNQQKLLFGRWTHQQPLVLLADEPTRGVDIGAKQDILTALRAMAAAGQGIVVVSSELEELLSIATRVIVLAAGRVSARLDTADGVIDPATVLHAAFAHSGSGHGPAGPVNPKTVGDRR